MSRRSKQKKYNQISNSEQQAQTPSQSTGWSTLIKVVAITLGIILLILAVSSFMIRNSSASSQSTGGLQNTLAQQANNPSNAQAPTGTLVPTVNGVQEVTITMNRGVYQPNPIRVKVNVPVRFTVDLDSVRGCYTSMVISDLGVSGRASAGSNTIEFTPTKTGTFKMTCSMGMADGTIIVEDANGNAPSANPLAAKPKATGSCGMGGGCGCGG